MSSAGQANEAGSIFRRDAATYLTVHTLAGIPVAALAGPGLVERLDFETSDETDDIRVTFDEGTKAFISAKRKCGFDHFDSTIDAGVAQLPSLAAGDFLALAVEEPTRDSTDSEAVWLGCPVGPKAFLDPKQGCSRNRMTGSEESRAQVRQKARIVEIPRSATNGDTRSLLTALNSAVEDGQGAAAVAVLSEHLHITAGRGPSNTAISVWPLADPLLDWKVLT